MYGVLHRAVLPPFRKQFRALASARGRDDRTAAGCWARCHYSIPVTATQRAIALIGTRIFSQTVATIPVEFFAEKVALGESVVPNQAANA